MAKRSSNKVVVPQCREALNQMKYEIAAELGLTAGGLTAERLGHTEFASELGAIGSAASDAGSVPWSHLATRDAGSVGGLMTRRLIQQAEQALNGL
ncbi:alpha/beta-type small acid-soluble spore protein [Paenibacillus oenotherae]|uniref:Alpha/beta-type small acid-soluble spore protein n=1 Tax=Paenibacillus oenotherae TaxID=1435645 RepID=A0ABS7D4Z7_9BACL|nr:alpha/beta-type small acid-soluble spore protein [Paenibacillus oenotherae]MBW7475009.1 alpha/beta-type small acid-soluble spore protein [Paenibacillus oenotherae]